MKKRHLILAILAVILVLSVSIGPTIAYFTTYAGGNGGYVIHLGNRSEIYEVVGDTKQVQIQNLADTDDDVGKYPIFIRAKVYAGTDCIVGIDWNQTVNWFEEDEYYYYPTPIYAAKEHVPPAAGDASTTSKLFITVDPDPNADIKPGDPIDVLVTYQSVPAVFDESGVNALLTQSWANQAAIKDINA